MALEQLLSSWKDTCPACGSLGRVGDKKTSDRRTFMPLLKSFLLRRMQSEACFKPVIDNLDPLLTHSELRVLLQELLLLLLLLLLPCLSTCVSHAYVVTIGHHDRAEFYGCVCKNLY